MYIHCDLVRMLQPDAHSITMPVVDDTLEGNLRWGSSVRSSCWHSKSYDPHDLPHNSKER